MLPNELCMYYSAWWNGTTSTSSSNICNEGSRWILGKIKDSNLEILVCPMKTDICLSWSSNAKSFNSQPNSGWCKKNHSCKGLVKPQRVGLLFSNVNEHTSKQRLLINEQIL